MKYYKIINSTNNKGIQYYEGYNENPLPWDPNWEQGGIYFAREDILAFGGDKVYEVEPVGKIYEEKGPPHIFKAHAVNLKYVGEFDAKTVQILIDDGADVHADDDNIICRMSQLGCVSVVSVLLAAGANIHTEGDAPLYWACENRHLTLVNLLLEAGADIHARDDRALNIACYHGHHALVKLLLEAGADIHAKNDRALYTASLYHHTEIIDLLKNWEKK